jgi:hypothetical protein
MEYWYKGLSFVASYVESMRPIGNFADNRGRIHYPETFGQSMELVICSSYPIPDVDREFTLQPCRQYSVLRVRYNGASAFVVVRQLPSDLVPHALDVLMESKRR